ncbi:hypothetical protein MRB53_027014 [Persea americana]|uniref:Uncharacterized protein n=1 Tax=Persea americana TaxID=3435 RepID=A0ACC2LKG3_PERAE|nr:hypothetical protein MRB53_027014 [Persea americana]
MIRSQTNQNQSKNRTSNSRFKEEEREKHNKSPNSRKQTSEYSFVSRASRIHSNSPSIPSPPPPLLRSEESLRISYTLLFQPSIVSLFKLRTKRGENLVSTLRKPMPDGVDCLNYALIIDGIAMEAVPSSAKIARNFSCDNLLLRVIASFWTNRSFVIFEIRNPTPYAKA